MGPRTGRAPPLVRRGSKPVAGLRSPRVARQRQSLPVSRRLFPAHAAAPCVRLSERRLPDAHEAGVVYQWGGRVATSLGSDSRRRDLGSRRRRDRSLASNNGLEGTRSTRGDLGSLRYRGEVDHTAHGGAQHPGVPGGREYSDHEWVSGRSYRGLSGVEVGGWYRRGDLFAATTLRYDARPFAESHAPTSKQQNAGGADQNRPTPPASLHVDLEAYVLPQRYSLPHTSCLRRRGA